MAKAERRAPPKPGEIFAVPRSEGGYCFVVHLATNRFGEAFGILEGQYEVARLPDEWKAVPLKHPVYTGKALVANGRWQQLAHREELLDLFPRTPEIYHSKSDHQANPLIGPFGSGEAPSGELRALEEAEARDIGLGGRYRQIMLEEEFERYLQNTLRD